MQEVFILDSVVNSCFMDKSFVDRNLMHNNRASHGFVYFKTGDNVYTFDGGKTVETGTGCFLYLPRYSSYSIKRRACGEVYCINLICNDDVFSDVDANQKCFSYKLKRCSETESIYKRVVREMYLKKPYYELTVKSLVYELAALIFSEINSEYIPSSTSAKLAPALSYIDEHYTDQELKIPFLAELCNMSENYFRRLFTKNFGLSPVKYINEKRIKYASEFLKSGLYSVADAATLTGFDDIGYFSRTYKKIAGESPSTTKNKS